MELEIKEKKYMPLVERTEVTAKLKSKATPSNIEVQEELAKQLNKEKELVVVKHIYSEFGINEADVTAYVYDSKESIKKFEKVGKKAKKSTEEAAQPAPVK